MNYYKKKKKRNSFNKELKETKSFYFNEKK